MNEFSLIEKYFRPLAQNRPEALGFKDDAAILSIPKGYELVVSSDILVAGTHFLNNEQPKYIAHRALRTNLSDMAAMGAEPYAYQLSIAFDKKPTEKWLKEFSAALLADQKEFKIFCSGGDTTKADGKLTISITTFGLVPKGKAVKRKGAKPGDAIVITGVVGDAFIGLKILQKKLNIKSASCMNAHRKPVPRTAISPVIRKYANASIDISDGLLAEINHISKASNLSARVDLEEIKFSQTATKLLHDKKVKIANLLTGGDDYELVLAVPQKNLAALLKALKGRGLKPQMIGKFTIGKPGLRVFSKNRHISFEKSGWMHF